MCHKQRVTAACLFVCLSVHLCCSMGLIKRSIIDDDDDALAAINGGHSEPTLRPENSTRPSQVVDFQGTFALLAPGRRRRLPSNLAGGIKGFSQTKATLVQECSLSLSAATRRGRLRRGAPTTWPGPNDPVRPRFVFAGPRAQWASSFIVRRSPFA